jgi:hypothetical protein
MIIVCGVGAMYLVLVLYDHCVCGVGAMYLVLVVYDHCVWCRCHVSSTSIV